jgi:hypothetical protein
VRQLPINHLGLGEQVPGSRHLSQCIAEGDGIAIIAHVEDVDGARTAEQQGAKAIAVSRAIDGIRRATTLPVLWIGRGAPTDADAFTLRPQDERGTHHLEATALEAIAEVRDEEELEEALDRHDPGTFLLATADDDDDPLDAVLELLPDVPAGKLAIAHVVVSNRRDVLALERAGIDAVLVPGGQVADLVGHEPVEV